MELAECKNWEKGGKKEDWRILGWRFLSQGMTESENLWHSYICKDFGLAEQSECRELGRETRREMGR